VSSFLHRRLCDVDIDTYSDCLVGFLVGLFFLVVVVGSHVCVYVCKRPVWK